MRSGAWARSRRRWRREAEARGVEIRTGQGVARIVVRAAHARGVVLDDGTEIAARCVISNAHPRALLALLADEPGEWRDAFSHYRSESATFRMNVALAELPDFSLRFRARAAAAASQLGHHHGAVARVHGPRALERARARLVTRARRRNADPDHPRPATGAAGRARREPLLPALPLRAAGTDARGTSERERAAQAVIDQVTRFAPNFRAAIVGKRALSPLDLERDFGLVGGDIFHGKLSLNQLFSARPMLGYGAYRMPVRAASTCAAPARIRAAGAGRAGA